MIYTAPSIVRMVKSGSPQWAGLLAQIGETRTVQPLGSVRQYGRIITFRWDFRFSW